MWLRNLLEGVVRIVIFMGYLMLCSHMKDIHRVFQYHARSTRPIFCYEHGLPLTVETCVFSHATTPAAEPASSLW